MSNRDLGKHNGNRAGRQATGDHGQDSAALGAHLDLHRLRHHHDRDVNAAIDLQRLATGAHAARTALPEASQAVTPGTAAGAGPAGGGKVPPVRHEHGQRDGSGQEEIGEHLCAPSQEQDAMNDRAEQERINQVYRQWHGGAALAKYAWHRPDVVRQTAARSRMLAELLPLTVGRDLSTVRALDVGCGSGSFLRQLIDWGALPSHLAGTELQQDRLDQARARTAPGVRWHLGQLDAFADASMDLVCAHTVFSSILDEDVRRDLASQMWRVLRPGGWTMIFDFRYTSPRNAQVRKVTDVELLRFWPAASRHYRTLVLLPPVGRVLAAVPWLLPEALATLVPPLRSHFIYMARKPETDRME